MSADDGDGGRNVCQRQELAKTGGRCALCEEERVVRMPLRTQRERLETLEQEERAEGIERRTEVAEDLDADLHSERHRAKRLAKLEAMIAF